MMQLAQMNVGDVWLLKSGPKRIAKVLSTGIVSIKMEPKDDQPPETKTFPSVTVLVTCPIYPIDGFVDAEEADITRYRRKVQAAHTEDDIWKEVWIQVTRKRPTLENPRLYKTSKAWEDVLQVHQVIGRSKMHEGQYRGGSITNTIVDGDFIEPGNVHGRMFDPIDADEQSQAEKEREENERAIIERYEKEKIAKSKELRTGDITLCREWGPVTRLKMQAGICGIKLDDIGDGKFNKKLRAAIAQYVRELEINPWDVYDLSKDDFTQKITAARGAAAL